MNFKDFDTEIAKTLKMPKSEVYNVLREVEKLLYSKVVFGQQIMIYEFGKFELKITKGRSRYNVWTEKMVDVPSSYRISFSPSPKLSNRLKEKTVYDGSQKKAKNNS